MIDDEPAPRPPEAIVLEEDHELCEAQISSLVNVLTNVVRAKSFAMLPRTVQDAVRWAINTRGGLPNGR